MTTATHKKNQSVTLKRNEEPLLEGRFFAGDDVEGTVCFDPLQCKKGDILVLRGDENIAADLKVSGFIIEDESDVLAEKLHEYFSVPVITGVPLARKILKESEKINLDGTNGFIYETVPFDEQIGEIEMNFVTHDESGTESFNIEVPVLEEEELSISTMIGSHLDDESQLTAKSVIHNSPVKDAPLDHLQSFHEKETASYITRETSESQLNVKQNAHKYIKSESTIDLTSESHTQDKNHDLDVSRLLHLLDDESEHIEVAPSTTTEVMGLNSAETFNVWGNALENVIKAGKQVEEISAAEALEHVINDRNFIIENSREIQFDKEEEYIAKNIREEETAKDFACTFIPTATKVYVHLVDEKLPSGFENFDGIIFTSSYDREVYLQLLTDTLNKANGKEVIAVTPPYEKEALELFCKNIYELRNHGFRNLSIVLPDYRNKEEIAEIKKLMSAHGLKRSSTFSMFINMSRTINVFRMEELSKTVADGIFIDLYRLKMNMLGVDEMTASTLYKEGMKKLVEFISQNLDEESRAIVNLSGFSNTSKAIEHLLNFKFGVVCCSVPHTDAIKRKISSLEKKNILEGNTVVKKKLTLKRR